jgi:SAM-dependent methyltransferase
MNVNVIAKRLLPDFESRLRVRRLLSFPRDAVESLLGLRDPLVPPHGLWFIGGEQNHEKVTEEFFQYFVDMGGLQSTSRVLDVGCGLGVMGARLTRFLTPPGSYCGIDIVKVGVNWAQRAIASRHPNFSFVHVDVFNKHYNPTGTISPAEFRFPYPDEEFDFVFLKSVLTHLLPEAIRQYLQEIRRVLKPSGRCLVSVFLLNSDSIALIDAGQSSVPLRKEIENYRVIDAKFPETAVGIPEREFLSWCAHIGLRATMPIQYGAWCGRSAFLSYQDIVLLAPDL